MPVRVIRGQLYEVRRVGRKGSSLAVTLPYDWCLNEGVKKGDEILILYEGGKLVLIPANRAGDGQSQTY